MRLMLIGTDRTLFKEGTTTRTRITKLGEHVEALDTIVFSTRKHETPVSDKLSDRTHAYATNSASRLFYGQDALRIARRLPRPDLVSAQDPFETGLAALRIARHFGVPLAVEIHTDFLSPEFRHHSLLNYVRVALADFIIPRAGGIYAVSDKVAGELRARYGEKCSVKVLPIYINVEHFAALKRAPHPHFKTALLWVGRMEKEKNPHLALSAFITARRAGFDLGLTFVGSGKLLSGLRARATKAGVDQWIEFPGSVLDVSAYYANADLLLSTSHYEGYGMAIIEALAAHIPVLATDVGVAREAGAVIAEGDYSIALLSWLRGPHIPGILKGYPYPNQEAYFNAVKDFYSSIVSQTAEISQDRTGSLRL